MRVGFVYTGGTIGSKRTPAGNLDASKTIEREKLLQRSYEFMGIAAEKISLLGGLEIIHNPACDVLSENMGTWHWERIAQRIRELIVRGVDGIAVTHGTDTMAWTMAACSYALQNPPVPIVFTGSVESAEHPETDAFDNLADAFFIAREGLSENLTGIFLAFHGLVHEGTKVKHGSDAPPPRIWKKRPEASEFFSSWNIFLRGTAFNAPLAKITNAGNVPTPRKKIKLIRKAVGAELSGPYRYQNGFASGREAMLFGLSPNMHEKYISSTLVAVPSTRALIFQVPGNYWLPFSKDFVRKLTKKIPIFIVSWMGGYLDLKPENLGAWKGTGLIPLYDCTHEAAWAKLLWVLRRAGSNEEITRLMLQPIAGELHPPCAKPACPLH